MIETVIDLLNEARLRELEAATQYMVHQSEMESKGFNQLSAQIKEIAEAKMKHAERLAERILFLRGRVISHAEAASKKGQEIAEMLATGMSLGRQAVAMYRAAAGICASENDQTTKRLFDELLRDGKGHLDFFETFSKDVDKFRAASKIAGL
jgi:bacterioferritin